MEFFSGIVLGVVVLAIAVYLIKELLGERLDAMIAEYKQKPVRSPNHHLVGSAGTVISLPQGEDEYLRVRIGIERWNARVSGERIPPIGTAVRVTAVEGLVLQIEERGADAVEENAAAETTAAVPPMNEPAAGETAATDATDKSPAEAQPARAPAGAAAAEVQRDEGARTEPQPKAP